MQDWLKTQEIKTLYIKAREPMENGHIESFHDKLRDECLNRELFGNLRECYPGELAYRIQCVARTVGLASTPK